MQERNSPRAAAGRIARGVMVCGATLAGWSSLSWAEGPVRSAQVGEYYSTRGLVLPTSGVNIREYAGCDTTGTRLLVYGDVPQPDWRTSIQSGYWLLDRTTRTVRLIHNNADGALASGASLVMWSRGSLAPDGRTISVVKKTYAEAAKEIPLDAPDARRRLSESVATWEWITFDAESGEETLLIDLLKPSTYSGPTWRPQRQVWVDDHRIAFTRASDNGEGRPWGILYGMDTTDRRIMTLAAERAGTDLGNVQGVRSNAVLYRLQAPDDMERHLAYVRNNPEERQTWTERKALIEAGVQWKLVDPVEPSAKGRVVDVPSAYTYFEGHLSPTERFFAYERYVGEAADGGIVIVDVQSGREAAVPDERIRLCGWHPSGRALWGLLLPEVPADGYGVLVEVPVDYVLSALLEDRPVEAPPVVEPAAPIGRTDPDRFDALTGANLAVFTEDDINDYVPRYRVAEPDPIRRVVHYARKGIGQKFDLAASMYALDRCNCVTFVERSFALALAWDDSSYRAIVSRLRHKDGVEGFVNRNHFTIGEWVPNNAWLLDDITRELGSDPKPWVPLHHVIRRKAFFVKHGIEMDVPDQKVVDAFIPVENLGDVLAQLHEGDLALFIRGTLGNQYCDHWGLLLIGDEPPNVALINRIYIASGDDPFSRIVPLRDYLTAPKKWVRGFKFLRLRNDAEAAVAREVGS